MLRLTLVALLLMTGVPAFADKLSLDQISEYLNGFRTATGTFTQLNDDGSKATGTYAIRRPGRARFEYDAPMDAVVVSNGATVGIVDGKSNTRPHAYPLYITPLKIILARKVRLNRAKMIIGHMGDGTTTTIRAQDPLFPNYGTIDLVFSNSPVKLKKLVVNEASGNRIIMILNDLTTGVRLADKLFEIPGLDTNRFNNQN